jgi:hypothetical protein
MKTPGSQTALCVAVLTGLAATAEAQFGFDPWNFDNASGSDATFSAAMSGGSGTLGTLTDLNGGTRISAPAGSGWTGQPGDLALLQTSNFGVTGAGELWADRLEILAPLPPSR